MKWQVAWKLTAAFPETHIADPEIFCAYGLVEGTTASADVYGCDVFSTAKDIIKVNNN